MSCRVTAAPLRCVMPAFEPGWEAISCRCRCRLRRTRNTLAFSLAFTILSSGCCVAAVVQSAALVLMLVCICALLCTHPCAPVYPCTRMRTPGRASPPLLASFCPKSSLSASSLP
jgi:hypothetical protein